MDVDGVTQFAERTGQAAVNTTRARVTSLLSSEGKEAIERTLARQTEE